MKIEIRNRFSGEILLCGEYESIKECLEKNKEKNLDGANLDGANLYGANLDGANLVGIKNYSENHSIFQEVIRKQKPPLFTQEQWGIIGQICILRLCWETIKKRFGKKAMVIFKKLSKIGFDEWEKKYKKGRIVK